MKRTAQERSTIDSWPPPREKWYPGFTAGKTGWCRSYAGRTLACGGKKATRREVEKTFTAKAKKIDDGVALVRRERNYREVLSEFLTICEERRAPNHRNPISARTLHNYSVILNQFGKHVGGGTPFSHTNNPASFSSFARKFGTWKSSGFDSVVTRVAALYNWAAKMDYIDKFRPGPLFQRPARGEIRSQRVDLEKCFSPEEFAKLYKAAPLRDRCWLGLGLFAAMNNSEVAQLTRTAVDLDAGVVDFRRHKTGKVRRVCPLPQMVVNDLRAYIRPDPAHADDADLFFITRYGSAFAGNRRRDGKPCDSISRLFPELEKDAGVEHREKRNFSGLRTSFYNLAPGGEYEMERKVIMGRAQGTIDFDNYLEHVDMDRLRHVVGVVWEKVSKPLADEGVKIPASAFAPTVPAAAAPTSTAA